MSAGEVRNYSRYLLFYRWICHQVAEKALGAGQSFIEASSLKQCSFGNGVRCLSVFFKNQQTLEKGQIWWRILVDFVVVDGDLTLSLADPEIVETEERHIDLG